MIRLFQLLIFGHVHNWNVIEIVKIYTERNRSENTLPVGKKYIMQCIHCGNVKVKQV